MAKKTNRDNSRIAIESKLTRPMYAGILLLLGIRSWGFALLFAVLLFLIYESVTNGTYTVLIIYSSLLVVIYLGAVLASVFSRNTQRAYAPVKYTFDSSKVVKETAATSQTLDWKSFYRWRSLGPYYLIYMSRRSFFVIPRERIPEGKADAFEALLATRIVRKRVRRRVR